MLAVLQRMGRDPPPAILVRPQDMAEAIRAATLLGSTVEALKSETDALRADLAQLADLRASIAKQRDDLAQRSAALAADKMRLAALIDARQQSLTEAEQALAAQRDRAAQLADQATNLKDLIAKMESAGSADRASAADIAAKAAALRNADPARLKPAIAFADARGSLVLPVAGAVLKTFGDPDGFGGVEKGMSIGAPPGATVSSPVDGSIVFAGPYRSYGQLLIINAGQGYYFVLAGMDRISVAVGQFVLAGEAVATMGDGAAQDGRRRRDWRNAAGSLYRTEKRRDGGRFRTVVDEVRHRKGPRMRRKVSYLALGVAIGAMAAGILPHALPELTQSAFAAAADTYRQLNLFGDVFEKIRNDYVEKPDESKLIEAAINGMLSSLDPHSSYMDAKAYRDMQVQTNGEFGGLGIEVTQEDGLIKVVSPIDDTPASKAGVMSGDIITGDRRRVDPGHDARPGGRQDARRDQLAGEAQDRARRLERGEGIQDRPRRDQGPVGALARRGRRHRLHPHHPVHRADRRRAEGGDGQAARPISATSSRATSSTCATTPAACSTSRSTSSTPSSTAARSFRRAAAIPTTRSASTRGRAATSPAASRWWC